jgi:hypothetical protein
MSKARELANLLDSGGDVIGARLGTITHDWNSTANKPTLAASATTDTTNASNISSGTIPIAQIKAGGGSGNQLRGDHSWTTNCTNHANCTTNGTQSNCANCYGTVQSANGSNWGKQTTRGTITLSGTNVNLHSGSGNCNCACACNC